MNYTVESVYKTSLRNRILNRNFLRNAQSGKISEISSIHEDYNTCVENVLNCDLEQNTFHGCYDIEHVNPVKWCNDYTMRYNELLCEKFGQSYSPYTGTKKIAIAHDMHPDGKIQAMVDFLRVFN